MRNTWKINIVLFLAGILVGCGSSDQLSQFDLAEHYEKEGQEIPASIYFSHENDSIAVLNLAFNPRKLLYSKNAEEEYISRYSIGYKVFTGYSEDSPVDSTTIHYSINQEKIKTEEKKHAIKILARSGEDYVIQITLTDENRNSETLYLKTLKKKDLNSLNYYVIIGKDGSRGQYQSDSFTLTHHLPTNKTLKIITFKRDTYTAAKPHDVTYNFGFLGEPDSTWLTTIDANGSYTLPPLKGGFYHILTDTANKKGFSVFHQPQDYPITTSLKSAAAALGYLLPEREYANLMASGDLKSNFEWQWKKIGGGRERARGLIKEYYQAVNTANELFTSFKPGWATDRGMIYIVYGPPRIVYRYDHAEVWIYGEENNLLSEVFTFKKINSSISDDIYELDRNINYKVNWNRMVTAWKEERGY